MKDDTLRLIGAILPEGTPRDAVHIAVAPAKCGPKWLYPAQRVIIKNGYAWSAEGEKGAGIVDPFLDDSVRQGQNFFVFLDPGSITSLRHEWTHPAFDTPTPPRKAGSEQYLQNFADSMGLTFNELMNAADNFISDGDYHIFQGFDTPSYDAEAFWKNWSTYTGRKAPKDKHFFSCSC